MQVALQVAEDASYIIECDGQRVGQCSVMPDTHTCSIFVDEDMRRQGVGTAAVKLMCTEAFCRADMDQLLACFDPETPDAAGVFIRAGFAPVRMSDGQLIMRLTRETYEARRRETWVREVYDAMCLHDVNIPHNIHHFVKVHSFARQIGLHEQLDVNTLFILEVAALTHDIGVRPAKEQTGACPGPLQEELGPPIAEVMLTALGLPAPVIRRVCFLIGHHHTTQNVAGIDWQILLEADFLVNMIEGSATQEGIDAFRSKVFRTEEGLRLLEQIRPACTGA